MTWHFELTDETTMDVWDHEDTKVASDVAIRFDSEGNPTGTYTGKFPTRIKDIARAEMEGSQPSAYNQSLIVDMETDNIERGAPSQS